MLCTVLRKRFPANLASPTHPIYKPLEDIKNMTGPIILPAVFIQRYLRYKQLPLRNIFEAHIYP